MWYKINKINTALDETGRRTQSPMHSSVSRALGNHHQRFHTSLNPAPIALQRPSALYTFVFPALLPLYLPCHKLTLWAYLFMSKIELFMPIGINDKKTKHGYRRIISILRLSFNEYVTRRSHLLSLSLNLFILQYELGKILVKTRSVISHYPNSNSLNSGVK